MRNLGERGVIQFIILFILIAGLLAGLYLVQKTQIFKPKASELKPAAPTTSFVLMPAAYVKAPQAGETIEVSLLVHTDIAAANLFDVKINFNKDLVALEQIDYANSIITSWVEQFSDNNTGTISLIGGVANPGLQTKVGDNAVMAKFVFKVLKEGNKAVSFTEGAMYSNADNTRMNVDLIGLPETIVFPTPSSEVTPEPSPTSLPTSQPSPCNGIGDVDLDGFVTSADSDLVLKAVVNSVTLTAEQTRRADVNVDGSIYSSDALLIMRYTQGLQNTFPACTISPSPIPATGDGDGNGDGKVNLVDLSILFSDFNKTGGFRKGIDLNGDGRINAFDFSLIRNLLIVNKVIRG